MPDESAIFDIIRDYDKNIDSNKSLKAAQDLIQILDLRLSHLFQIYHQILLINYGIKMKIMKNLKKIFLNLKNTILFKCL